MLVWTIFGLKWHVFDILAGFIKLYTLFSEITFFTKINIDKNYPLSCIVSQLIHLRFLLKKNEVWWLWNKCFTWA